MREPAGSLFLRLRVRSTQKPGGAFAPPGLFFYFPQRSRSCSAVMA